VHAKGGGGRVGKRAHRKEPRYRRAVADLVQEAARQALARPSLHGSSQRALRLAVLPILHRGNPLNTVGARRLRLLLLDTPGIRMSVRFAERPTRRPIARCPICTNALEPIRNRTLLGDRVTLGYRCPRCRYWTHLKRRVPIRYTFRTA
jgi:hypothetical protein